MRDMDLMECDELHGYIRFFSQANMMRHAYIAAAETFYWKAAYTNPHIE